MVPEPPIPPERPIDSGSASPETTNSLRARAPGEFSYTARFRRNLPEVSVYGHFVKFFLVEVAVY